MIGLSRPTLAILNEDYPKVRNIESKQEINELLNFLITILNIKSSSDDEQQHLDKQMILIFDLIKTKFGSLTVPEIKEAFKMYVSKEFSEIKVFRMLDCIVVGEILRAFVDFRNESLKVYDDKKRNLLNQTNEMSEEEKNNLRNEFLKTTFEEVQSNRFSSSAWLLFADVESKLNTSIPVKKRLYRIQNKKYLFELELDVIKQKRRPHHVELLETAQKNSMNGKLNVIVQNRCRAIVVCNYLKKFKEFCEFKKAIENE